MLNQLRLAQRPSSSQELVGTTLILENPINRPIFRHGPPRQTAGRRGLPPKIDGLTCRNTPAPRSSSTERRHQFRPPAAAILNCPLDISLSSIRDCNVMFSSITW